MDWIPIILSIVATVVSVGALFREWRFGKPDALQKYEAVVTDLLERVDKLEAENKKARAEIKQLEDDLEDYRLGVVILITQMEQAKIAPKWKPKERKP